MRITVKDDRFWVLGYIEDQSNGDKIVKDASFRVIGYYRRSSDTVIDENFRIVAHGYAPGILFNR